MKAQPFFLISLLFAFVLFSSTSKASALVPLSDSLDPTKTLPKAIGYVNDFEGVFTEKEIEELTQIIKKHEKETTNEIAIVTITSFEPFPTMDAYSLALARYWGVGKKEKNNGIVITFSVSLRKIRIENGLGIEERLTDQESKEILQTIMIPELRAGNPFRAIKKGLTAIFKELERSPKSD